MSIAMDIKVLKLEKRVEELEALVAELMKQKQETLRLPESRKRA